MKAPSKYTPLIICGFLLIFLFSCGDSSKRTKVEPEKFKSGVLKRHIESTFKNIERSFLFSDTLTEFYKKRKYKPIWFDVLSDDSKVRKVLDYSNLFIREEGLFLNPFNVDQFLNHLPDTPHVFNDEYYAKLAEAELILSSSMLHMHKSNKMGYLDPKVVFGSYYELPVKEVEDFKLFSVLNASAYDSVLNANRHLDSNFLKYKAVLDSLYDIQAKDTEYVNIDTAGIKKLEVGDSTHILPQIAHNLVAMGLISEKSAKKASPHIYNKEFKYYIRIAQQKVGLHDDGIIGSKSLAMFNQSISRKIDDVKINMERERWVARPEKEPFVLVNLPQYQLFLHYVDSIKSMDICIGKPRPPYYYKQMSKYNSTGRYWDKPRDFETPQIHSYMEYFVMKPTWNVPRSIVIREMYHQMRKDSSYLRENNYEVYRRKEKLNPDTINWRRFSATRIPYRFVQTPGAHNALGMVKYIFRNKHHIYFHDTPQKSKFKWTQRSVSHGCVRLSDPLTMGDFVLKDHDKYNYDDFRIFLGYEPLDPERLEDYDPKDTLADIQPVDSTTIVHLDDRIPIYFLYRTVWMNEDGVAEFHSDVYGKNEKIYEGIRQKMANLPSLN